MRGKLGLFLGGIAAATLVQFAFRGWDWRSTPVNELRADELVNERDDEDGPGRRAGADDREPGDRPIARAPRARNRGRAEREEGWSRSDRLPRRGEFGQGEPGRE